jgi:cardiolipin synthase
MMSEVTTEFYTKTEDAWASMLLDLQNAKQTIEFEQYIFSTDIIGRRFLEVLEERAKAGVKIRMVADAVGSWGFYRSSLPLHLNKIGIEVKFFNPISAWRIPNFTDNFFRDHRKIIVIDNTIAHLGGVGIQDDMAKWRDTHMRITGALVQDIKETFEVMWASIHRPLFSRRRKYSEHFIKKYNVLTNSPRFRQRYMYYALIWNIRNAQKYIYITTPYFIPDMRMMRVLKLAAKRGVDVRIIVPEIGDHFVVDFARQSYYKQALKGGIKVYVYQGTMMHAKTAVVDDYWATAGSFNVDNMSAYFNDEVNIGSDDKKFIDALKYQFLEDLHSTHHIKLEDWVKRPLRYKLLEFLTWPFHGIM